jgi:HAD superfamily hydrolase (TIGR01549 family)
MANLYEPGVAACHCKPCILPNVIQAMLFDLDETLILDEAVCDHAFRICALSVTNDADTASSLAHSAATHARRLWQALPVAALEYANRIGHSAFEGLWAQYEPSIPSEALLESVIENYRTQTWVAALEECGLHGDPVELAALWAAMRSRYPLYPDADELLVQLKKRYKIGIVTNGVRHLQRQKLEGCGLLHWVDTVAISGEVGIGKPERGIFDWVAGQLNVPLENCVMVGDNAARDVQGGINAGIRTVYVERGFKPRTATPTLEVNSLLEMLPWLESQV